MNKLLVVDDESDIVNFIKIYFKNQSYMVYTAYSAQEALEKINAELDIILLDIMMPEMDGLELCQKIRNLVTCPIIFLTARVEERDRIEGLIMGGDDYILKPFSIDELYARVEAHLRRERRKSTKAVVRFFKNVWINYSEKKIGVGDIEIKLTRKEYEIVNYLSKRAGQIFSKENIYEKNWGYDAEGDADVAVTEHVKRIRKKMESAMGEDYFEFVETVWGIGYRWKE